jgi:FixJ family two-component response regulator
MDAAQPILHVVDDDESVRASMARLLKAMGHRVEAYESASDFLQRYVEGPGCLILDVRMPGQSGLDLQQALGVRGIALPIVFLTGFADVPMTVKAMRSGAEDFLTKPVEPQALLEAVTRALARDTAARARRATLDTLRTRYETLTAAERRIFALVVTGLLNKQIAWEVGRTERTVKAHRSQVMQKMAADSLADLVRMAGELGIGPAPG